jgi:hypothetical protein
MEKFLADYGLVWVGNDPQEQKRTQKSNTNKSTSSNTQTMASRGRRLNEDYKEDYKEKEEVDKEEEEDEDEGHIVSFAEFARYIKELNDIIFSEPTQIVKDDRARKARLAHASEVLERIRVIYYKNGLMIKRGPFRPCHSDSYLSFVQDVIDGYFPSEFRNEYPDGVTFDLVDQHQVDYVEGITNQSQDLRMSTSQFLNRLTKKTILQNGEIVEIRGDIEARLHLQSNNSGSGNNVQPAVVGSGGGDERPKTSGGRGFQWEPSATPDPMAANYGKTVTIETEASKNPNQTKLGSTAKIQVKWIDHTTLLMTMFELNTVQELREEIARHFNQENEKKISKDVISTSSQDIEFRITFPSKLLLDGMTLMEASLVPNGTIHARKI